LAAAAGPRNACGAGEGRHDLDPGAKAQEIRVLFNTLLYAKFFAVVFTVSWMLYRWRRARLAFLLVASYVFYAGWSVSYLPLLFGCSTLDYVLGRLVENASTPRRKKAVLVATLVSNLGILAVFKYWNFGMETARWVAERAGLPMPDATLHLALPIGISFFTFMSLSYVIDVYRGTIPACRSYLHYLTYIAFFPHLVAGPIVRGRDLLPALERDVELTPERGGEGLFLIACGLVKKVIIGDYLALNLVDRVFAEPASYSAVESMTAMYGYAVQVYCDFSGYSDIAIGSALLLGYRFPKNFDAPFRATNIVEFWRRWHVSLSVWLRDYVYIPLGGSRSGRARKYINVFLTMLICGIWHGAAWCYVIFGAIQGVAVAVTHWWRDARGKVGDSDERMSPVARAAAVFATFTFVALTFALFRAESLDKALALYQRLPTLTTYHPNLHGSILAVIGGALVLQWSPQKLYPRVRDTFIQIPAPAQAGLLFLIAVALREVASTEAVPFVYFQF
jgi:alginate O-acetyltransferase complex protein AlgI